ncbi:MAG: hypothetical protein EBU90_03355 [Proteobacteria bacterium]|nr:hypothetical protein [Pseudomonadota bacterium]NBP13364.1 hypothetical protein [bacterium]
MDKNLIIDPVGNFVTANNMFAPADYFCEDVLAVQENDVGFFCKRSADINIQQIKDRYGITPVTVEDFKKEYNKIVICYPVNTIDDPGTSIWDPMYDNKEDSRIPIKRYFTYLADIISKLKYNHIIFLDYHDRAVTSEGEKWLSKNFPSYSGIFKREYRRTHTYDYSEKVFPFPFLMFGNTPKNSCWKLFEERTHGNRGVNECVWPGGGYVYTPPGKRDEWCGRQTLLDRIAPAIHFTTAQGESFFELFNTFKFWLHTNGSGHLCKRFYEGLSRDSLMMMESMDVVFPFDSGDFFAEECVFRYPKEFFYKLNILQNDDNEYNRCKSQQEYILRKYFNYKWINEYVDGKINQ